MISILHRFLHLGVIIGPLPYTFANQTIADATQLNANLAWIVSQTNANATGGVGTATRNLIYNGAMQLAQRIQPSVTFAIAGGTKAYGLDRWQVSVGVGSAATIAQFTGGVPSQFNNGARLQRTTGNAATTPIQMAQSMESADSYVIQGQTINLSFWAQASAGYSPIGNALTASIVTGTGTDENVFIGYTGSATPLTQTFNITNNWAQYQVSGVIASTATEFAPVFTMNPTGTAGTDYVNITGVQVELGPSAAAYDFRPFSETVARCQRYYQKSFYLTQVPGTNFSGNATIFQAMVIKSGASNHFWTLGLPVTMRVSSGTIGTIYNPQAANNQIRDTAGFDFSASSIAGNGISAVIQGTANASSAVGDQVWANWSLDSEL